LQRCLDALQRRAQNARKPSVCRRLATLEHWSRVYHWQDRAAEHDREQAARRAHELREQERQQAMEDIRLLQQTIRGAVATSAVILSTYSDKDGQLARQDATLADVARLLKTAVDALYIVNPAAAVGALGASDIERILRHGSAAQRSRVLDGLREVQSVVDQVEGRR
jgi:hypothetical protein